MTRVGARCKRVPMKKMKMKNINDEKNDELNDETDDEKIKR